MDDEPKASVSELVDTFRAVPVPTPAVLVDLDAATALVDWLQHPHVCSGGMLSDEYVPPYLRALISEVGRLRQVEDAAARLLRADNERRWDASEALAAKQDLHKLLLIPY